jgi:hypothetical protein
MLSGRSECPEGLITIGGGIARGIADKPDGTGLVCGVRPVRPRWIRQRCRIETVRCTARIAMPRYAFLGHMTGLLLWLRLSSTIDEQNFGPGGIMGKR